MRFTPETDSLARRLGWSVIVVLALGLVLTIVLGSIETRQFNTWSVFGTFESGVSGLKPGSEVRLGGAVKGRVVSIEVDRAVRPREVPDGEVPVGPSTGGFVVTFELDASVMLHTDAQVVLDQNPLSGLAELDVVSVGGAKSAPLPGSLPGGAKRAPVADPKRPLNLSFRGDAATRILGRAGAADLRRITSNIPTIRKIFLDAAGTHDPATGEDWGPVDEDRIAMLQHAFDPLWEKVSSDRAAWDKAIAIVDRHWKELSKTLDEAQPNAPAPVTRVRQLSKALDAENGLRAVWSELSSAFRKPESSYSAIKQCIGPMFEQASLIAALWRDLRPSMEDDLLVMKVGFSIAVTELWFLMGPDLFQSLIRLLQKFSDADENALVVILAANRAALSADSLREAVEASRAALADGSGTLSPEVAEKLRQAVTPAIHRYRRDLDDLMKVLNAAVSRR